MNVDIGQLYIEPGVNFPFSHHMQVLVSEQLSEIAKPTLGFSRRYGESFDLIIRLSARKGTEENVIMGPTVFKKAKDVEYSLFLPYDAIMRAPDSRRAAVVFMLDGIQAVLQKAGVEAEGLPARREAIIERLCSDPMMIRGSWPTTPGMPPSSLH